jgi:hypothetical protein
MWKMFKDKRIKKERKCWKKVKLTGNKNKYKSKLKLVIFWQSNYINKYRI